MEEFVNRTAINTLELSEAELDFREYDDGRGISGYSDQVVAQDMQLIAGQTLGWRSQGYPEPYICLLYTSDAADE